MTGKRRILIVEDVEPIRQLLSELLDASGFEVVSCGDGVSALDAAATGEFHVVITDYRMPKMDGLEMTRHMRTLLPASRIIGLSSENKRWDFYAAGADAFLLKPYRYDDILVLIESTKSQEFARVASFPKDILS